ncbi:hypothetical protein CC86DRAFT_191627 [Ophiobolus disseminans]|uniref:F-box domain-containing protein n=1 Tax=Ophiobolus disseminans TaxID=1469910 RepID=A0A6A7A6A8_9PLEO|nr:hypothetical protein CC86DRAFT_191627 [Ophiobolus disseminans]
MDSAKQISPILSPLMRLPTELQLMVYDHVCAETRRKLNFRGSEIYYRDLDVSLLRTSKHIRQEASSILNRRRRTLTPCLTLRLGWPLHIGYTSSYQLVDLSQLLSILVMGHSMSLAKQETTPSTHSLFSEDELARFEENLRVLYPVAKLGTHASDLAVFYHRSIQQFHSSPCVVVRIMLELVEGAYISLVDDFHWIMLGLYESRHALQVKFVLLVKAEHLERCQALAAKVFDSRLTQALWTIELMPSSFDPAVD